jgi:hypothetical protein
VEVSFAATRPRSRKLPICYFVRVSPGRFFVSLVSRAARKRVNAAHRRAAVSRTSFFRQLATLQTSLSIASTVVWFTEGFVRHVVQPSGGERSTSRRRDGRTARRRPRKRRRVTERDFFTVVLCQLVAQVPSSAVPTSAHAEAIKRAPSMSKINGHHPRHIPVICIAPMASLQQDNCRGRLNEDRHKTSCRLKETVQSAVLLELH